MTQPELRTPVLRGPSKIGQLKSDDSYAAEAAFFQSCSAWSGVR